MVAPLALVHLGSRPPEDNTKGTIRSAARGGDGGRLGQHDGKELARQTAHHQGDGVIHSVFPAKAEAIGLSLYTIRLLDSGKKTELSHMSAPVRAKNRDALKVLYIQGGVDWEYRFLRQAVSENPSILLDSITQLSNQSFLRQAARGATPDQMDATPLAAVRAAAQNYDVMVLANLNPEFLDAETQKALLDLVRKRGGGILFFSGNSPQTSRFRGLKGRSPHWSLTPGFQPQQLSASL